MNNEQQHTPEPWYLIADNGADFTVISTKPGLPEDEDGISHIDFDNEVLGVSEWLRCKPDDLRRIVACVNACEGSTTEDLERLGADYIKPLLALIDQRDALAAENEQMRNRLAAWEGGTASHAARTMIATADDLLKQRDALLAAAKKALAECVDLIATPAGDALESAIGGAA